MKKFFTLVVLALLAVGCAKEYDDSGLRELINGLDARISELETNVSALQSAIGDGKFVRKVEEYKDPDTGRTTGVTVTYTDGNIVHFNIVPTDPTSGPVFSVIRNGAGELVWAVDGVAVKMDGQDVPVYLTPTFSIDEEGNLIVEVDGKTTNLGPVKSEGATLQDGIFTNLAVTDEAVVLTLSDGSTVNIPFAEAFRLVIDRTEFVYTGSDPIEIPYTVTAKTEATVVDAFYDIDKFSVDVQAEKVVVTPLTGKASGKIMLYADSKVGLTSIVTVIVEAEGFRILDEPYSAEVNYLAEGEDAVVTANAVSNIAFDVIPVDEWIHVVSVKSTAYVITLKLDDNLTGEVREGTVNVVRAGTEEVVQTIKIAQLPAVIETGPKNLSKKGAANSYIVSEAGEYKFWAVKGNSGQEVSPAAVEVLWETWNNAEEVTANSVVASVKIEGSYVVFSTPETLKPGNAVIAAKDAAGVILWSWHIWVPATEVANLENGVFSTPMMDRNLGALVAAATGAEAPVESFGLTYQWGRKDPFPGPKAANSSSNATVAGVALSSTEGAGEADESKIPLDQSIQNPTLLGHSKNGDWLLPADNTLWQDGAKTMYDPCPPGYRVPALEGNAIFFSDDASAAAGWVENSAQYYFAMGNPQAVFPFAGYRDDYGPDSMTHAYDRAAYWSSSASSDEKGAYLNVRAGSAHAKADAGKSRAGSVRCVVADETPILPPDEPTPGGGGSEGGTVDLSKDGSANSYMIAATSAAGAQYKFKAVKGNSEESVGSVAKVEVVWETWNTAEVPGAGSVVAAAEYADGYVTITMPETLHAGNALIAAKDAGDVILWSWHIWVPAAEVTAADYTSFIGGAMMNLNLGAIEPVPAAGPAPVESFGLLYQWGRKDPFVGAAVYDKYPARAAVSGETWTKSEGKVSMEEAIKNPTILYIDAEHSDDHDWNSNSEATLWDNGGKKTIYDPCPVGYKVPVNTGDIWTKTDEGWNFDVENHVSEYTAAGVRIPLAGYVECYGGSLYGSGGGAEHTYLWSASHHDTERGECLYVRTSKEPGSRYYKAYRGKGNAGSVRCIAE